jgi:hypothetical protein
MNQASRELCHGAVTYATISYVILNLSLFGKDSSFVLGLHLVEPLHGIV